MRGTLENGNGIQEYRAIRIHDSGEAKSGSATKVEGGDPGSPENPKMLKKFIYCTGITTILFIIIYLLMKFEYLNLRNIII